MTKERKALVEALVVAWAFHPKRSLGQMLSAAMNISRGELRSNPAFAEDAELLEGLRALVPDEWEQEKDNEKRSKK